MTAPSILFDALQRVAAATRPVGPAGGRLLPGIASAQFPLLPGAYGFNGEVDVITTPAASRVVRLYERQSGKLIRETVTSGAGLYSFPGVSNLRKYYIVALDLQPGGYNAAIADYLTPT